VTLYLPADVIEASERRNPPTGSKRSISQHRWRRWAIEQVINETWNALSAPYYQPRESIADLCRQFKGEPPCSD
jgi:hypothetical protein